MFVPTRARSTNRGGSGAVPCLPRTQREGRSPLSAEYLPWDAYTSAGATPGLTVDNSSTSIERVPHPAEIEVTLSAERLHRFIQASGSLAQGLRLYRWNVQLASAYWTPLHFLEIAVRNAVHGSMTAHHGTAFWFREPGTDLGATWLFEFERNAIEKAISKIFPPVTAGKVVAELHFSFWVGLLSGHHIPGKPDYHDAVWVKGKVSERFPNMKRSTVFRRLDRLRRFRNRIAHHEHILNSNLDVLSADIEAILRTLDPSLATWVRAMSTVEEVRAARPLVR
jgi:hypothetical protein